MLLLIGFIVGLAMGAALTQLLRRRRQAPLLPTAQLSGKGADPAAAPVSVL